MTGYSYGENTPMEECGICGGEAYAEFCDVGVGMVQIAPFHCMACGAQLSPRGSDGRLLNGWQLPPQPSSRGERVTGYYISHGGGILEMTFDADHNRFNERMSTSTSRLLYDGWVRITKLEGYAIDLPPFMTAKTRRALSRILKDIEAEDNLGDPYVKPSREEFGQFMPRVSLMDYVSRLPTERMPETGLHPLAP